VSILSDGWVGACATGDDLDLGLDLGNQSLIPHDATGGLPRGSPRVLLRGPEVNGRDKEGKKDLN
jgi:hypothetical protein